LSVDPRQLAFGIIWRMGARGAASGALLGALFPLLAVLLIQLLKVLFSGDADTANTSMLSTFALVGALLGFVLGGVAGIVLGLITGVALAAVTWWAFRPLVGVGRRYRMAAEITCLVFGGAGALLLVLTSGLSEYGSRGWGAEWGWLVWGVVPTLVATIAAWWAGRRVATWVVSTASEVSQPG
jgi:hypothetical protein